MEVFKKSDIKILECRNCRHTVVGQSATEKYPVNNHPQAYFETHKEIF